MGFRRRGHPPGPTDWNNLKAREMIEDSISGEEAVAECSKERIRVRPEGAKGRASNDYATGLFKA
jgi:hypothetical protein